MSRTYALALIFAAVTLVSGLFYGQYRYLKEVAAYAAGVHERVIQGQLEKMSRMANIANQRMDDPSKERFQPILPFVEEMFNQRDAYLKKAKKTPKSGKDPVDYLRYHNAEIDSLFSVYASFLREFGEYMDLREEEIVSKVAHIKKEVDKVRSPQPLIRHSPTNPNEAYSLFTLDYLELLANVVQDVVDISGGRIISCFFGPEYFPIVSTGFLNPQRGETISTRLSVGNYSTTLHPEDVTIVIDGDSLRPNMTGYIDYDFIAKRRGRQILEMELIVRNRLTGEVKSQGTTEYHYFVQ